MPPVPPPPALPPALAPGDLSAILASPPPAAAKWSFVDRHLPAYQDRLLAASTGKLGLLDSYKDPYLNHRLIARLAVDRPDRVTAHVVAWTHRKLPVLALRLRPSAAAPTGPHAPLPVYVNCAHHANEWSTPEYCYALVEALLGPKGKAYRERFDIWVIPIVNVDGAYQRSFLNIMAGRKNGRRTGTATSPWVRQEGVDLNRNYPFRWAYRRDKHNKPDPLASHYWGPRAGSEPEVAGVMGLARALRPVLALSFHTSGNSVLYPYTSGGLLPPRPDVARHLALTLARWGRTGLSSRRSYSVRQFLYPVYGADQDWLAHELGTHALLVEGPLYQPKRYLGVKVARAMVPGILKVLDELAALPRVTVRVRDDAGQPVVARVVAGGRKFRAGEQRDTDPRTGRRTVFFLKGGRREVLVTVPGQTMRRYPVVVKARAPTRLDVVVAGPTE